jgi:hypothetical protein
VACDYVGVHPAGAVPDLPGGLHGATTSTTPAAPPPPPPPPPAAAPPAPQQEGAAPAPPAEPVPVPAAAAEGQQQPAPAAEPAPAVAPAPGAPAQPATPQGPLDVAAIAQPLQAVAASVAAVLPAAGTAPALFLNALAAGAKVIPRFGQCGGTTGACAGALCADAPFPGYRCADGLACTRQNRFFWQCLDDGQAGPEWATTAPAAAGCAALNEQCGGAGGACDAAGGRPCADAPFTCCQEGSCQRQNNWFWECRL